MSSIEERLEKIYALTTGDERAEIQKAGCIIRKGGLVGFPTETVYGLGANALDADAVKRTYEAKGRPSDNPLILHVCSMEMADSIVELNWMARFLMEKFWPGPLTLVLPSKPIVPLRTRGGLPTAAIRMPDNRITLELIRAAGVPISGPSANRSGRPSPTDAQTVRDDIGPAVAMVLDGGCSRIGVESTVIDVTGSDPVLLRAGGMPREKVAEALGMDVILPRDSNMIKRSPGTRYRHYAPSIPLVLSDPADAAEQAAGKKWAWMGTTAPDGKPFEKVIYKDENEYAKELFRAMRTLEKSGAEIIVAQMPGEEGIGLALKDRLVRASGI